MKIHNTKGDEVSKGAILFVFMLGTCFLGLFLWELFAIQKAEHWPTVEATVIRSELTVTTNIVEGNLGSQVVRKGSVDFAFTYSVAGRQFVSTHFGAFALGQPSAYFVTYEYPVGRHFTARYNQASPDEAVAEPGSIHYSGLILSIILFGLGAAGWIYNLVKVFG